MCANLPNIYLRIWQILYNDFPIFTCSVFSDYITSQPEVLGLTIAAPVFSPPSFPVPLKFLLVLLFSLIVAPTLTFPEDLFKGSLFADLSVRPRVPNRDRHWFLRHCLCMPFKLRAVFWGYNGAGNGQHIGSLF